MEAGLEEKKKRVELNVFSSGEGKKTSPDPKAVLDNHFGRSADPRLLLYISSLRVHRPLSFDFSTFSLEPVVDAH